MVETEKDVIAEYHVLQKKLAQVESNNALPAATRMKMMDDLKRKMKLMGGIESYQKQSLTGEAAGQFDSSYWVLQELRELHGEKQLSTTAAATSAATKITLLDVGAIKQHYKADKDPRAGPLAGMLEITSIDLNSEDEKVVKADFFDFAVGKQFDVIVISLVINFIGDVKKRGEMIKLCEKAVKMKGHLFIVLPIACIENARFMNQELFFEMLSSCGLPVMKYRTTKKLFFCQCLRTDDANLRTPSKDFRRVEVRKGVANYNNFCIILEHHLTNSNKKMKKDKDKDKDNDKDQKPSANKDGQKIITTSNQRKRKREKLAKAERRKERSKAIKKMKRTTESDEKKKKNDDDDEDLDDEDEDNDDDDESAF